MRRNKRGRAEEKGSATIPDEKTLRLCRQAERALAMTLSGECGDEVLSALPVVSVTPAPNASRLLVTVALPDGASPTDVLHRLERARGFLRSGMASVIHRKRVPDLVFGFAARDEPGA